MTELKKAGRLILVGGGAQSRKYETLRNAETPPPGGSTAPQPPKAADAPPAKLPDAANKPASNGAQPVPTTVDAKSPPGGASALQVAPVLGDGPAAEPESDVKPTGDVSEMTRDTALE